MAAECREIGRRAERNIERIVDAAEAESFCDLRIEAPVVADLIAQHHARREASCLRFSVRRAGIGEDAVERLYTLFVEGVIAKAAGEIEPVIDGIRSFTEQRELFELVFEMREKEDVRSCAETSFSRNFRQRFESGDIEALSISAVVVRIEAAGQPV